MKNQIFISILFFLMTLNYSCEKNTGEKIPWHHPLYLANNDFWSRRIPVTIQNNTDRDLAGDPLKLMIGEAHDQAPLVGVLAEGVRVVTAKGEELTFRLTDLDGKLIEKGSVPKNSIIVFPVECKKDSATTQFIYFDNPSAWAIGDFYLTHRAIINEGLETETNFGPLGWEFDLPEGNSRIDYARGEAHTGNRSIKISQTNENRTAPYGATQRNLHLLGGVKYALEGWVKAKDVIGDPQITVLFGDLDAWNYNLGSETRSCGEGTFDWKKILFEFTPPKNVTGANLQVLLNGTGTVWFDDFKLTCQQEYDIVSTVQKTEKLSLKKTGASNNWLDEEQDNQSDWPIRTAIKTLNFDSKKMKGKLICVQMEEVFNRLHAEINENTAFQVTAGPDPVPFSRVGNYILFRQDVPAQSELTNYVYFNTESPGAENPSSEDEQNFTDMSRNLIQNFDFESQNLSGWKRINESGPVKISSDSKEGKASVEMKVLAVESEKEAGLEQTVPVEPGQLYFFSAWIKSSDMIEQPDFMAGIRQRTLRAQFINGEGDITGRLHRIAVNPQSHVDNKWSQLHLLIMAPEDADSVKLQLVNAASGVAWFDDVAFTDVVGGVSNPHNIEYLAAKDLKDLILWQEDPIVKVFQDDLPPSGQAELSISVARNESEPMQLVIRGPEDLKQVQIKVNPPKDKDGNKLNQIDVGIVGYVPINYPSSYYSDRVTPYWRQKIIRGNIGSDGWRGMWPDPILPFPHFDLTANVTQPVWIEFDVPKNAASGDYMGEVQLIHNDTVIKEVPFKVHVWDFELPDESHMIALYDARIRNYDFFGYDKSELERKQEIWEMLKDHRLCPDVITPAPVIQKKDGEISFDFTAFDQSASYYFDTLKFSHVYSPWFFYLFGWANLPRESFGENAYPGEYPYTGVDRSQLRPEFIKAYQSALRSFWDHMKQKGWADKLLLYVSDEPHADPEITQQMRTLCDMIHEVDPQIPVYVSTWWYRPEYSGYIDVWGVSHHGGGWGRPVPVSDLAHIRQAGDRLWFTTDGKMCTDTPYLGFERLLPYFCFKYDAEAYEFWGSNWYTFNPYDYGWHSFIRQSDRPGDLYWIRYPNGDATFIYPGQPIGIYSLVPTIRIKLAREGVEDYEYLYYLDALVENGKKEGKNVSEAEKAIQNAMKLITIPSADGRYSTKYLPNPYLVIQARNNVAQAIEGLIN